MSLTMGSISSGYRYFKSLLVKPPQPAPADGESQTRALHSVNTSSSTLSPARPETPATPSTDKHPAFDFEVNPAAAKLEISAPQLVITTSHLALSTKLKFIKRQQAEVVHLLKYVASLQFQSSELMKKQGQQERELRTLKISFLQSAQDEVDGLKDFVTKKMPIQRSPSRKTSSDTQRTISSTKETQDLANKFYVALSEENQLPASQFPLFKELCTQFSYACLNISNIAKDREIAQDQQSKLAKQREVLTELKNKLEKEEVVLMNKQIALFHQETQANNQILTIQNPAQTLGNTDSLSVIKERLDLCNSLIETLRNQLGLDTKQASGTSAVLPAIRTNHEARSNRANNGAASPILKAPTHWATQPASEVSATLPFHRHPLKKFASMSDIWLQSTKAHSGANQEPSTSRHKASHSVSFAHDQENGRVSAQSTVRSSHEDYETFRSYSSAVSDTSTHLNEQEQVSRTKPTMSKEIRSINASIDQLLGEVNPSTPLKRHLSMPDLNKLFNTDRASFSASLHAGRRGLSRQTSLPDLRANAQPAPLEAIVSAPMVKPSGKQRGINTPLVAPLNIQRNKFYTLPKGPTSESQETPLSSPVSSRSDATRVETHLFGRPEKSRKRYSQGSSLSSFIGYSAPMSPVAQTSRRSEEIGL